MYFDRDTVRKLFERNVWSLIEMEKDNFEKGKSRLRKRFQTPKLIQFLLFQNGLMLMKAWKWGENCFAISLFFPFLDLLMVVARIFLRIKAKNDGWGGVRRISNILGQILVHYYCCIGTKPSFHGAVDSISNMSYLKKSKDKKSTENRNKIKFTKGRKR